MSTVAVLPVKRFAGAKQRLAPELGGGSRVALASAMLADVLAAIARSSVVETVLVVSSEPAADELLTDMNVVLIKDLSEKGQSHAALSGLARAAALGYASALLLPGDTPLLDPRELDDVVVNAAVSGQDVLVVPDRHGAGTNALLVDPSGPFEPQFGPGSCTRHIEQAQRLGLRWSVEMVPSLALDVDTPDDLAALMRALEHSPSLAPRTQGVLSQLERSQGGSLLA